ncbi:hypothetical protein PSD17_13880 [Pseudonocardia sp. D17]|nr:hypothetical protein PSD17_13880 [Pseudonocardia sp. D17]
MLADADRAVRPMTEPVAAADAVVRAVPRLCRAVLRRPSRRPRRHDGDVARLAVLAVPVAVPVTMAGVFALFGRLLSPRAAHLAGFAVYWAGWCGAFPVWVLGLRGCRDVLGAGRRPRPAELAVLALPVVGAVATELVPNRRLVGLRVALVAAGTAAVNALGEELLWRGLFLDRFPGDQMRAGIWPLAGFTVWHLAPQLVRPSDRGRGGFLAGAATVGTVMTVVAWRAGGVRAVLLPHVLVDACGVRVARFWTGR